MKKTLASLLLLCLSLTGWAQRVQNLSLEGELDGLGTASSKPLIRGIGSQRLCGNGLRHEVQGE